MDKKKDPLDATNSWCFQRICALRQNTVHRATVLAAHLCLYMLPTAHSDTASNVWRFFFLQTLSLFSQAAFEYTAEIIASVPLFDGQLVLRVFLVHFPRVETPADAKD